MIRNNQNTRFIEQNGGHKTADVGHWTAARHGTACGRRTAGGRRTAVEHSTAVGS